MQSHQKSVKSSDTCLYPAHICQGLSVPCSGLEGVSRDTFTDANQSAASLGPAATLGRHLLESLPSGVSALGHPSVVQGGGRALHPLLTENLLGPYAQEQKRCSSLGRGAWLGAPCLPSVTHALGDLASGALSYLLLWWFLQWQLFELSAEGSGHQLMGSPLSPEYSPNSPVHLLRPAGHLA